MEAQEEDMEEGEEGSTNDTAEQPQEYVPTALDSLLVALEFHEGAPDKEQLEVWKDRFGTYFASSIDNEDIYVWKTLKRLEYRGLANSGAMEDATAMEEAVVKKCLLYPKPTSTYFAQLNAGIIPTLFKQVMYQSGFISEESATSMIRRI